MTSDLGARTLTAHPRMQREERRLHCYFDVETMCEIHAKLILHRYSTRIDRTAESDRGGRMVPVSRGDDERGLGRRDGRDDQVSEDARSDPGEIWGREEGKKRDMHTVRL